MDSCGGVISPMLCECTNQPWTPQPVFQDQSNSHYIMIPKSSATISTYKISVFPDFFTFFGVKIPAMIDSEPKLMMKKPNLNKCKNTFQAI